MIHLLLTRPEGASVTFAQELRDADAPPFKAVIAPVMRIVPVEADVTLHPGEGVMLSSAAAVTAQVAGVLRGRQVCCVGPRTAQAAREAGAIVEAVYPDAARLLADLPRDGAPLVHFRGTHTTGDLAGDIAARGRAVRAVVVYDQLAVALSDAALSVCAGNSPVIVPIFSPRSGALLRDGLAGVTLGPQVQFVAISAAAAATVAALPAPVEIAVTPDGAGMRKAVLKCLRQVASP